MRSVVARLRACLDPRLTGRTEHLAAEHAGERLARDRSVAPDREMRQDQQARDDDHPDDAEPTGRAGPAGIEERLPDATSRNPRMATLRARSVPRTGGVMAHAARRVRDCVPTMSSPSAIRISDGMRNQSSEPTAAIECLAEPREQCRQAGRGEAATVRMSGVRPDPASVHAGQVPPCRERADRPWPHPSLARRRRRWRGDAGRSISLPVIARRPRV